MQELLVSQVEQSDIVPAPMDAGDALVVLERHEQYITNTSDERAGSLYPEAAAAAYDRQAAFFEEVFTSEDGEPTLVLFTASDTRYAHKGYRSMETAQVAQRAASSVLRGLDISPSDRIINLGEQFPTPVFRPYSNAPSIPICPEPRLREPQIFDDQAYLNFLLANYGSAPEDPGRLSQAGWAAHERDAERETREALGAEGVYDILAGQRSLSPTWTPTPVCFIELSQLPACLSGQILITTQSVRWLKILPA